LSAPVGPGGEFRPADKDSASFLAALARTSPDLIAVIDDVGRLKYSSPAATAMLGYGADELVGTSTFELVHPVDQIGALEGFASTMSTPDSRPDPLLIRLRHADGTWLQTEIIGTNHLHDPDIAGLMLTIRDVSGSMRTDDALRTSEERYRLIVELAREGIAVLDRNGIITFANHAFADLLGSTVIDIEGSSLFGLIDAADASAARARITTGTDSSHSGDDLRLAPLDGRTVWARIRASALREHDGTYRGAIVFVDDVTDRRALEQLLAEEARRDPLTGVANRKELFEVLSPILEAGALTAALYVDLDGFKEVNDAFGHTVGDELLCNVAARIRSAIRNIDTVARVGGDEFVVICRELDSTDEAVAIGHRVREGLGRPFGLSVATVTIDSSIGIAFGRTGDADRLLARADEALYRAKRKGRGRIEITFEDAAA
jgi:diguanylate cyclase (GGDEF)-like protein/PAS domain S-box-containing protein